MWRMHAANGIFFLFLLGGVAVDLFLLVDQAVYAHAFVAVVALACFEHKSKCDYIIAFGVLLSSVFIDMGCELN